MTDTADKLERKSLEDDAEDEDQEDGTVEDDEAEDEDDEDDENEDDEDDDGEDEDEAEEGGGDHDEEASADEIDTSAIVESIDTSQPLERNEALFPQLEAFSWEDVSNEKRNAVKSYLLDHLAKESDTEGFVSPSGLRALRNMAGIYRKSAKAKSQLEKAKMEDLIIKDFEGHTLTYLKHSARIQYGYFCDRCGANHSRGPTYSCEQCDFDMCLKCHADHLRKVDEKYRKLELQTNAKYDKWRPSETFNQFANEQAVHARVQMYRAALDRRGLTDIFALASVCCLLWQALFEATVTYPSMSWSVLEEDDIVHALTEMGTADEVTEDLAEALCGLSSLVVGLYPPVAAGVEKAQSLAIACLTRFPHNDSVAEEAFQLVIAASPTTSEAVGRLARAAAARFEAFAR